MLDNQIDVADIHHASVISEVSKQTLSTHYKDEPVIVYRHYNPDDQVYNIRAVAIDNISPNS